MAQSFREWVVWQRAMRLTLAVYRLTQGFPREEPFGLTGHVRRSAVSILSAIAEGQGRVSPGECRQFLGMARGSNCEVETRLEIARSLDFGNPKLIDEAESLAAEGRKMPFGLLHSLETQKG